MSNRDEFTDSFHEMRNLMTPPPELVSRLEARLSSGSTDLAPALPGSTPSAKPVTARKPSRPKTRARRGVLLGASTAIVLAAAMVVGGLAGRTPSQWPTWPDPVVVSGGQGTMTKHPGADPAAYADVYAAVAAVQQVFVDKDSGGLATAPEAPTSAAQPPSYTSEAGTNIQVPGVDEGDLVKTDGSYIYIAKGRTVAVVAAQGAESRQVATIDTSGLAGSADIVTGPVIGMMLQGKTLVVLFHGFSNGASGWGSPQSTYLSLSASSLKVAFYDISNPELPRYLSQVSQSGSYVDSRLSDGVLYLVSTYSVDIEDADPSDPATFVPQVGDSAGLTPLDPGCITIPSDPNTAAYSVVTAVDVAARAVLGEQAVLGEADTIYMNAANLYLASGDYDNSAVTIPGYGGYIGTTTTIVRIGLNSGRLAVGQTAVLPGGLLNQFSLDEQDGYLRVVTTRNNGIGIWVPALWVLDSAMALTGVLPELVTNEQVQSVRFDGDVAYVVTFQRMDPLFAIDLSDPANPRVTSALKIPGFSSYLHVFGSGLLLGLGTNGDASGLTDGLKLSMFDVSDPLDVREVATLPIDADSTEVAIDHKAAFVDPDKGLIGFPTGTYSQTNGVRGYTWDYRMYQWTGTTFRELSTFTLGRSENGNTPTDTTIRAIEVSGDFYLLASDTVDSFDMAGYTQIAHLLLS